jgi:glutamine synthetase
MYNKQVQTNIMTWILEYLWLDANQHMRSKIRVMEKLHKPYGHNLVENQSSPNEVNEVNEVINKVAANIPEDSFVSEVLLNIPEWSFDGSSTGQASTDSSEIILNPVNYVVHPFIKHTYALLVLCECNNIDGTPATGNSRREFIEQYNKVASVRPWFGIEQEFFFFDKATRLPVGWKGSEQTQQGEYYCGVNRCLPVERKIMDQFLETSLYCNLKVCGINQEVAPAQWEYQIGIIKNIEDIDHLIFAKYILFKLSEECGLYTVFHPKPLLGNWNGSGCHINISTIKTRDTKNHDCYQEILNLIGKMEGEHTIFIHDYCGRDNHMRLTGTHETSSMKEFTFSVGGRNTSIRIPYHVKKEGCGYFEDRRPGSSINYYQTICKYLKYME